METERPPLPPFTTVEAAAQKVRLAEMRATAENPGADGLPIHWKPNGGTVPSSFAAANAAALSGQPWLNTTGCPVPQSLK